MRLYEAAQCAVIFKAGDTNTNFLALVLDGKALVEAQDPKADEAVALKIINLGDVLGESNRKLQTMTETTQSMCAELATSRNSERYLADLFASNSNVVPPLTKSDNETLPKTQNPGVFTP